MQSLSKLISVLFDPSHEPDAGFGAFLARLSAYMEAPSGDLIEPVRKAAEAACLVTEPSPTWGTGEFDGGIRGLLTALQQLQQTTWLIVLRSAVGYPELFIRLKARSPFRSAQLLFVQRNPTDTGGHVVCHGDVYTWIAQLGSEDTASRLAKGGACAVVLSAEKGATRAHALDRTFE